jgi:protein-tyrosine-phosphatase
MSNKTILIVCTGNICRSPMAAAFLQARLAQDPARSEWQVLSAGLWAVDGNKASRRSAAVMMKHGHDLGNHRARQVTAELMQDADLVLGLTPNHVEALRLGFPRQAAKIHLLAEMAGYSRGVEDPYGQPQTIHRVVAREIHQIIEAGYEEIVARAEREGKL